MIPYYFLFLKYFIILYYIIFYFIFYFKYDIYIYIYTEGVLIGGAGVQIVETRIFWEVLWWKHLHMKNMQKNNGKKSDPCPQPGLSPDLAHGSELFFLVFSRFWPNCKKIMEKPKKTKKTKVQTHVPSQASPQTLPMGLNFLLFFWFSRGFGQTAKNHGKTKKNKKNKKFRPMSPARPLPRPCPWVWTFCFFCFFWFSGGFGQI